MDFKDRVRNFLCSFVLLKTWCGQEVGKIHMSVGRNLRHELKISMTGKSRYHAKALVLRNTDNYYACVTLHIRKE